MSSYQFIQIFFNEGIVTVYDHFPTRQAKQRVVDMVCRRLRSEHPGVEFKVIDRFTIKKEKLFKTVDRIDELKKIPSDLISESEELELRNLEVIKMQQWSEWKD